MSDKAQPDEAPFDETQSGEAPEAEAAAPPAEDKNARAGIAAARASLADVRPEPGAPKQDAILNATGVRRAFGGLVAVDVAHLEVQRGTITALIGPNGAGKTTFFNLLTGFDRPSRGEWVFDGRRADRMRSYQVARAGMVRTFQLTKALTRMSVMDNMLIGAADQIGERFWAGLIPPLWKAQEAANRAKAMELLERFKLIDKREDYAGELSGGQRKLLEMARALMLDPKMVMLDEPMAGVNPALKQTLLEHIKNLREEGMTVLFVEHDMDMVHEIADWVAVMAAGQLITEGTPDQISADRRVIDAYLGAHHDAAQR
ncbi:ABC transporter ATP-binding protein [Glycomyces algeriensis]|uniref:ABC transporter ATP-binding protein n=1 Tax=Glycomyces algeriensis TaxID=256037 RepID=A0A9W6G8K2_9ACTN|nr:ABC transporter ATP-binding protein [Glycomyces algeriensis]MDA1367997.1 ABC transporter ATP-binding protein [Glycomyces algeriensis]MDR7349536.1 branched-chain amino acid transport system ATP-binding protein [Glycomyces algeriensis]GLI42243.1 ABC transporter ATP-binding protein [Glycomyces algeriensis]